MRLLIGLAFGILAVAAIWTYGRLSSPTPAQEAALAVMQAAARLPSGENGFPMLLGFSGWPRGGPPDALRCGEVDDCIAVIEAAPDLHAEFDNTWRPLLLQAQRALRAPVFRDHREEIDFSSPFPNFTPVTTLDSLRALEFLEAGSQKALAESCLDARAAIRWATAEDTLITARMGMEIFHQHARLIADMRRRAPQDPLPAQCMALAETPDPAVEGTLCNALRGEWHYQQRTMLGVLREELEAKSLPGRWMSAPVVDVDWMRANLAQHLAPACSGAARQAAVEDRAFLLSPPPIRWVDRVAYSVSSLLVDIAVAPYSSYFELQLDYVAQRRVLAAFLQMEAMDRGLDPTARFEALPAALRDGPRPLRHDPVLGEISVEQRSRSNLARGRQEFVLRRVPSAS
ncbi:hypothetical protein [Pseudomarimonas salicorniae]|uniref:Uncharacterized protein n=1 Tax=Pseudomarimonas salicorniae TaxID=2933270 RepID=A0ABT0GI07_9GAMM|nr:hypothetical protein [Lysobacter sp. CAU 1642]MCK7594186.1 hypothetical protein [Lysobacter sp. CAU 1642]